jgi:hypothetical protein
LFSGLAGDRADLGKIKSEICGGSLALRPCAALLGLKPAAFIAAPQTFQFCFGRAAARALEAGGRLTHLTDRGARERDQVLE